MFISGKLVVVTGIPSNLANKTEAFDLTTSKRCPDLPPYPLAIYFASGAFINNRLVICGGTYPITGQCYSLGPKETAWQEAGTLKTPRYVAASTELNGKMITMGGNSNGALQSTEIMDAETKLSTYGPNLPTTLFGFCMVKVNASRVLLIGGYVDNKSVRTVLWYSNDQSFKPRPDLTTERRLHACGLLTSEEGTYVVVAGGDNGTTLDSIEYLDLQQPTEWKTGKNCKPLLAIAHFDYFSGPKLPQAIEGLTIVEQRNQVVAMSGRSDSYQNIMYRLGCVTSGCAWEELPKRLQVARRYHLSFVVPDNFVNCP